MNDDDPWQRSEPSGRGPSTPNTMRFDPLASAIGVFCAISIPVVVVGYTRPGGANGLIIALGIVIGLLAGALAGVWLAHRDGQVWRGPQL